VIDTDCPPGARPAPLGARRCGDTCEGPSRSPGGVSSPGESGPRTAAGDHPPVVERAVADQQHAHHRHQADPSLAPSQPAPEGVAHHRPLLPRGHHRRMLGQRRLADPHLPTRAPRAPRRRHRRRDRRKLPCATHQHTRRSPRRHTRGASPRLGDHPVAVINRRLPTGRHVGLGEPRRRGVQWAHQPPSRSA
jgi:hypothetical protein